MFLFRQTAVALACSSLNSADSSTEQATAPLLREHEAIVSAYLVPNQCCGKLPNRTTRVHPEHYVRRNSPPQRSAPSVQLSARTLARAAHRLHCDIVETASASIPRQRKTGPNSRVQTLSRHLQCLKFQVGRGWVRRPLVEANSTDGGTCRSSTKRTGQVLGRYFPTPPRTLTHRSRTFADYIDPHFRRPPRPAPHTHTRITTV